MSLEEKLNQAILEDAQEQLKIAKKILRGTHMSKWLNFGVALLYVVLAAWDVTLNDPFAIVWVILSAFWFILSIIWHFKIPSAENRVKFWEEIIAWVNDTNFTVHKENA